MPASSLTIILDAGPLVAGLNARDPDHAWAKANLLGRRAGFIVTSAAVAEATHGIDNDPRGLAELRILVSRMQVDDPAPGDVLTEMTKWKTRMDYADACAVLLARKHRGAVVLTTDHRDFSIYRVPFVSPYGEFRG